SAVGTTPGSAFHLVTARSDVPSRSANCSLVSRNALRRADADSPLHISTTVTPPPPQPECARGAPRTHCTVMFGSTKRYFTGCPNSGAYPQRRIPINRRPRRTRNGPDELPLVEARAHRASGEREQRCTASLALPGSSRRG